MEISPEEFQRLEARISRIEEHLGLSKDVAVETASEFAPSVSTPKSEDRIGLEFRIGEFWLAQVGALILLFGAAFFISYPLPGLPALVVSLLGYLAIAALSAISRYWKDGLPHLSNILFGGSLVLLYFATLRLHFFSTSPVIHNKILALFAVSAVLAFNYMIAIIQNRKLLVSVIILLSYLSALLCNQIEFAFALITITSGISVFLFIKRNWQGVILLSLAAAYLTHLLLLFNNPIIGRPVQLLEGHHFNFVFLFLYALLYGVVNIFSANADKSDFFEILLSIVNAMSAGFLIVVNALAYFRPQAVWLALFSWLFFMILAFLNRRHSRSSVSTSYYATFGYVALSAAILVHFPAPKVFVWLSLQSLFVIITALWFRSRIIIVANIFIYVGIYSVYLLFSGSNGAVNFSYALTALASARILNWKKERLALKTDLIRNIYLVCAFIIILYGLYHGVPGAVVSIAWLGAALFYMALSLALKNIKYRYMAIMTVAAVVLHVFIVDAAKLTAGFRIILFLSVGIIILLFSMFYSKVRIKAAKQQREQRSFK